MSKTVKKDPILKFISIADLQFADVPDGRSFKGKKRYYRNARRQLESISKLYGNQRKSIEFVMHFGDLIDLHTENGHQDFKEMTEGLKDLNFGPVYHMIGNHDLYPIANNEKVPFDRDDTLRYMNINQHMTGKYRPGYYSFTKGKLRFVVLDSYDISILAWPEDHPHAIMAKKLMDQYHPEEKPVVNSPDNLIGRDKRYVGFNGGVSQKQIDWMEQEIIDAKKNGETVIICTHVPFVRAWSKSTAWLWNDEEVLKVIEKYDNIPVVLAGHAHSGGYIWRNGIHHIVFEGAVESSPDCYGLVEIYEDRLIVKGQGTFDSHECIYGQAQSKPHNDSDTDDEEQQQKQ